ncbi:MAG: hypothetical protein L6R43_06625 [Planctomycetes bacterium]|nr:hypothetical protein [Planctomycetota bacterium]
MRFPRSRFLAPAALLLAGCASAGDPPPPPPETVVGLYDSRAVAVAFANSEGFQAVVAGWRAEAEEAKRAGDEAAAAAVEAKARARQDLFHRQAFCGAPVEDILAEASIDLAGIARAAGVQRLVSRWAPDPLPAGARTVDLTREVIAPFRPSEKVLRIVEDMRDKPPIPESELPPDA